MKELSNKDLASNLRQLLNEMCTIESNEGVAFSSDKLTALEEASRRLEFGYTPPEAPTAKSPIEEKRAQERHEAEMAIVNQLKRAGLGGTGMFTKEQITGNAYIFQSHKGLLAHPSASGSRIDYHRLILVDDNGTEYVICENGDYGKRSFPAPVED